MARPSTFTPELGDTICGLIAERKSLRQIASIEGMPRMSTIMEWMLKGERGDEQYRAFAEQYARAKEMMAEFFEDDMLEIADNKTDDFKRDASGNIVFDEAGNPVIDHAGVARAKLQIDTRKWIASKLKPKKYGDKVQQEVTGADGGPVKHSLTVKFVGGD
jgi:hypothetical protein